MNIYICICEAQSISLSSHSQKHLFKTYFKIPEERPPAATLLEYIFYTIYMAIKYLLLQSVFLDIYHHFMLIHKSEIKDYRPIDAKRTLHAPFRVTPYHLSPSTPYPTHSLYLPFVFFEKPLLPRSSVCWLA